MFARRSITISLLAVLAGSLGAAPQNASISAGRHRCHFRDAQQVRITDEAVVAKNGHPIQGRGGHHFARNSYIGCDRRSGRTTQLVSDANANLTSYFRLTGAIAAVQYSPECEGCDFSAQFTVTDLRTGERIYSIYTDDTFPASYWFDDVALDRQGNFAAVRSRSDVGDRSKSRRVIYRLRGGRKLLLDSGMGIRAHSLRRVRGTYYWRHSGVRSFTP